MEARIAGRAPLAVTAFGADQNLAFLEQVLAADLMPVAAIELGIGGYQPHPAADVFHYRYGDCKDKHTLLEGLLDSIDIHASSALINSSRDKSSDDKPQSQIAVGGDQRLLGFDLRHDRLLRGERWEGDFSLE